MVTFPSRCFRCSRIPAVLASALIFLSTAPCAQADPLVVTQGQMALFYASLIPNPYFDFLGTDFRFTNSATQDFIEREWPPVCSSGAAGLILGGRCRAGDTANLSFTVEGELGAGPATVDGRHYDALTYRGTLTAIADPVVFQPADEEAFGFAGVHTGFVFTGSLRGFDGDREVFAHLLTGRGTAHMRWENEGERLNGRPVFLAGGDGDDGPTFQFAQTPEPASLLLVATGIAGLASRRRRGYRPSRVRLSMDSLPD